MKCINCKNLISKKEQFNCFICSETGDGLDLLEIHTEIQCFVFVEGEKRPNFKRGE